jgi:transposase
LISLQKEVKHLSHELKVTKEELVHTKEELRLAKEEIIRLKSENTELRRLLEESKHKKTSTNSSIAPSQDINRKTKSLRKKSNKKPGGQEGHEGLNLAFKSNPDKIIDLIPNYCQNCGRELTGPAEFIESRQVTDIPIPKPITQEFRQYGVMCPCGYCNREQFPNYVTARTCYGPNVESMCSYLNVRQYISINRISEMFADVFNLPISQGTVANKIQSFSNKCLPYYQRIKEQLLESKCIGSDESGVKINGKLNWIWTWVTPLLTYIVVSSNRGAQTIHEHFPKGFIKNILVHDCWKAHFNTLAETHQICIAHLLRELEFFIEAKNEWAKSFLNLLMDALELKKLILLNPTIDYQSEIRSLEDQKYILLNQPINEVDKKLNALKKRLGNYDQYLFTFMYHKEVPPDNNGSERAIRNIKVKLKVSGQFKTPKGVEYYAVIRSLIDTTIKNKNNVFDALSLLAKFA